MDTLPQHLIHQIIGLTVQDSGTCHCWRGDIMQQVCKRFREIYAEEVSMFHSEAGFEISVCLEEICANPNLLEYGIQHKDLVPGAEAFRYCMRHGHAKSARMIMERFDLPLNAINMDLREYLATTQDQDILGVLRDKDGMDFKKVFLQARAQVDATVKTLRAVVKQGKRFNVDVESFSPVKKARNFKLLRS